jgi:aldehyde:ferredoxin oxidoreductase
MATHLVMLPGGDLGAVMGAKGLKAVVIDDLDAPKIRLHDVTAFQRTVKKLVEVIKSDRTTPMLLSSLGTPGFLPVTNQIGSMPTENYRAGSFASFASLAGEAIKEKNIKRGGKMHGCMPGCVVQCSVAYNDEAGNYLTSGFEYETIAMLGANLKIGDVDAVAKMDRLCDELGLDTIETGSALSQAMAAGKLKFGDIEGVIKAIEEIGENTLFGAILGQGTVAVSREFGLKRVPAIMGQAIPAHDPRACKTAGVTYATSPMGADHTAGTDYSDPYGKEGQVQRSKELQIFLASVDSLGYCMFAIPTVAPILQHFADLINARYGTTLTEADIPLIGVEAIRNELEFNRKAGIELTGIRMPDFVGKEALPPSNSVFDVPQKEIDTIWKDII